MGKSGVTDLLGPEDRADADRSKDASKQKRPRKFNDGERLLLKNAEGICEFDVTVVSAEYNKTKHSWMYSLKDCDSKAIKEKAEEKDLAGEGEG